MAIPKLGVGLKGVEATSQTVDRLSQEAGADSSPPFTSEPREDRRLAQVTDSNNEGRKMADLSRLFCGAEVSANDMQESAGYRAFLGEVIKFIPCTLKEEKGWTWGRIAGAQEIQGIPVEAGGLVVFDRNGFMIRADLSQDFDYQGFPCAAGTVLDRFPSGRISGATLRRNMDIQGWSLAASDTVSFYESGKLRFITLPEDDVIQGYALLKGSTVKFYESGQLRMFELPWQNFSFHEWNDLTCETQVTGGQFWVTHKNKYGERGSLEVPSYPLVQKIPIPWGSIVGLYEGGRLKYVSLTADSKILGTCYEQGMTVIFDEGSGAVRAADHTYKKNSE